MTREQRRRELEVAAALLLLQRRAKRALRASFSAVGAPLLSRLPNRSGDHIVSSVTTKSIVSIRTSARSSARGLSLLPDDITEYAIENHTDLDRALRAGASLGRQWPAALEEAEGDVGAAVKAFGWRLDRTASTESMAAWNGEASALSARAYRAGLIVTDSWHAMLDACPACADLDGQSRTRPDTFDQEPPLHGHCLCWLDTDYAERLAA
jgi:hypothetical protein